MTMNAVPGAARAHIRPASRDLESVVSDSQVFESSGRDFVDAGNQLTKLAQFVQSLVRLPALSRLEYGHASPYFVELCDNTFIDSLMDFPLELGLPNERRKHAQGTRRHK